MNVNNVGDTSHRWIFSQRVRVILNYSFSSLWSVIISDYICTIMLIQCSHHFSFKIRFSDNQIYLENGSQGCGGRTGFYSSLGGGINLTKSDGSGGKSYIMQP
jgi:hypothetical protein